MEKKNYTKLGLLFSILALEFVLSDALFVYFAKGISADLGITIVKFIIVFIAFVLYMANSKVKFYSAGIMLLAAIGDGIARLPDRLFIASDNMAFIVIEIAILASFGLCAFLQLLKKRNRFINYISIILLVAQAIVASVIFNLIHPIEYVEMILYYTSCIAYMLAYRSIIKQN